jgi:hypothetical protein
MTYGENDMLKRSVVITALWVFVGTSIALSQLQRLAIPATDISIDEHGVAKVKTYCLDYGRTGPKAGARYNFLLSGEDSAVIIVDGKEMSLERAIRDRIVQVKAVAPSLADMEQQIQAFDLLGQGNPERDKAMLDLLRLLPPEEQRKALHDQQNPDVLQIINLSGKKIQFKSRNAVMGASQESSPDLAALSFSPADASGASQVQGSLWLQQIQTGLSSIGFPVTQDGKLGPETKSALEKFQQSQGLQVSGKPDEGTVKALHKAQDDAHLRSVNTNGDFIVLRVENRVGEESRYRVVDGGNSVVYDGNSADELITKIVAAPMPTGAETKYLDLDGFTPKEIDNLSRSFRTFADQSIREIPRDDGIAYDRDLLVSRGVRLETKDIKITEVPTGTRKGLFKAALHFLVNFKATTRDVTLNIYSRSKQRITDFVGSFKLAPDASGFDGNVSIAQLVSRGRKRLREKYGSTGDLDVVLNKQTKFITVEVSMPRDRSQS